MDGNKKKTAIWVIIIGVLLLLFGCGYFFKEYSDSQNAYGGDYAVGEIAEDGYVANNAGTYDIVTPEDVLHVADEDVSAGKDEDTGETSEINVEKDESETEPAETEPVVTEPVVTEPVVTEPVETEPVVEDTTPAVVTYKFRNNKLLNEHYEKHGRDMGFASAAEYEAAASAVINNPEALYKTEAEDGDGVYYVESTNEFVVLSTDGYIRTYFLPDSGKKYFDKQ